MLVEDSHSGRTHGSCMVMSNVRQSNDSISMHSESNSKAAIRFANDPLNLWAEPRQGELSKRDILRAHMSRDYPIKVIPQERRLVGCNGSAIHNGCHHVIPEVTLEESESELLASSDSNIADAAGTTYDDSQHTAEPVSNISPQKTGSKSGKAQSKVKSTRSKSGIVEQKFGKYENVNFEEFYGANY